MTLLHTMTGRLACLLLACAPAPAVGPAAAASGGTAGSLLAGMTATERLQQGQQKFDCNGRIIEAGVPLADVLAACGPPAWRDQRTDSWIDGIRPDGTVLVSVFTEEWIFDFGPDRLLHFLYFRDGKVAAIRTGGYGGRSADCAAGENLAVGDSKLEVFRKCGVPARVGTEQGAVRAGSEPDAAYRRILDNDFWYYDFGPDRFVRLLTFSNGLLKNIERGGYGH
jgi:hypothetical protein